MRLRRPRRAAPARRPTSLIRLSTVLPNTYAWGKAGERWAELVKERPRAGSASRCAPGTRNRSRRRPDEGVLRHPPGRDPTLRSARPSTGPAGCRSSTSSRFAVPECPTSQGHRRADPRRRGPARSSAFVDKGPAPVPRSPGAGTASARALQLEGSAIAAPADMKGRSSACDRLADLHRHLHRARREPGRR